MTNREIFISRINNTNSKITSAIDHAAGFHDIGEFTLARIQYAQGLLQRAIDVLNQAITVYDQEKGTNLPQ